MNEPFTSKISLFQRIIKGILPFLYRDKHYQSKSVVLIDYENLGGKNKRKKLDEIFTHPSVPSEHHKIIAYANWCHQSTPYDSHSFNIIPVQVTPTNPEKKDSTDLRLSLDAMEFLLAKENFRINTFVIASGDGDFIPLYKKIRGKGKRVIVFSNKNNTGGYVDMYVDELYHFSETRSENIGIKTISKYNLNLIRQVFTALYVTGHKEHMDTEMLNKTFRYTIKGFKLTKLGFKNFQGLLRFSHSKNLVDHNTDNGSFLILDKKILTLKELDKNVVSFFVSQALNKHNETSRFLPFGMHGYVMDKILDHILTLTTTQERIPQKSIGSLKSEICSITNLNLAFDLLKEADIIVIKEGIGFCLKCQKEKKALKKQLRAFIRNKCIEAKFEISVLEWQSILDKCLK